MGLGVFVHGITPINISKLIAFLNNRFLCLQLSIRILIFVVNHSEYSRAVWHSTKIDLISDLVITSGMFFA